jgi:hypothetical protein
MKGVAINQPAIITNTRGPGTATKDRAWLAKAADFRGPVEQTTSAAWRPTKAILQFYRSTKDTAAYLPGGEFCMVNARITPCLPIGKEGATPCRSGGGRIKRLLQAAASRHARHRQQPRSRPWPQPL